MYFSREDYRKIEQWLLQRGVKDTEFPEVTIIEGNEKVPIIQDNRNVIIPLSLFAKQVADSLKDIVETDIGELNTTIQGKIDDIQLKVILIEKSIEVINSNVDTDKVNIESNRLNIKSLTTEISNIKKELALNYASDEANEARITNVESRVKSLSDTISVLNTIINDFNEQLQGKAISLGETSSTAYPGDKGKDNADSIKSHRLDLNNPHQVTASQVGLGNVDNTSDIDKPVSRATQGQLDTKVDKVEGKTLTTNDFTNVHKEKLNRAFAPAHYTSEQINDLKESFSAGEIIYDTTENKYVYYDGKDIIEYPKPSEGTSNQVMTLVNGKILWRNVNAIDAFTYGVQWTRGQRDPHLIRIGNKDMHRELPIQNEFEACIYRADTKEVVYKLNQNDWRFREVPKYETWTIQQDPLNSKIFDLSGNTSFIFNKGIVGMYLKHEGYGVILKIKSYDNSNGHIIAEDISGKGYHLTSGISYRFEVGSCLSGYDGELMLKTPDFYIRSWEDGDICSVRISKVMIDKTWYHQKSIFMSPIKAVLLRSAVSDWGYLSELPTNSFVSVINTNTFCRAVNNNKMDGYLDVNPFQTALGKAACGCYNQARNYARSGHKELMSYTQYKNILVWLYVIEYANFDIIEDYNPELTSEGYKQGGLGKGITALTNELNYSYISFPITPTDYSIAKGNNTYSKNVDVTFETLLSNSIPSKPVDICTTIKNNLPSSATAEYTENEDEIKINLTKQIDGHTIICGSNSLYGNLYLNISGLNKNLNTNNIYIFQGAHLWEEQFFDGEYNYELPKRYYDKYLRIRTSSKEVYPFEFLLKAKVTLPDTITYEIPSTIGTYRGIANMYDDGFTYYDGIYMNDNGSYTEIYTTDNPELYGEDTSRLNYLGDFYNQSGCITSIKLGTSADIFPDLASGDSIAHNFFSSSIYWESSTNSNSHLVFGRRKVNSNGFFSVTKYSEVSSDDETYRVVDFID